MISVTLKKQNVNDYLGAAVGSIIAAFVCLPFSKDADNYLSLFDDLPDNFSDFNPSTIEYLFWGWLQWIKSLGGDLAIAIAPLLFIALLIKFKTFRELGQKSAYIYTSYACIFFLLHEGTQFRLAIGAAFALWACSTIVQRKWITTILLCVIGMGFHITSIILPFVFFICYKSRAARTASWVVLFSGIFSFFAKLSIVNIIILPILSLLGGRYLEYADFSLLETQKTSGAYGLGVALFLIILYYVIILKSKSNDDGDILIKENHHILITCLSVCVFGDAMLFWLFDTVAVASRLAELLTLPIIPLLVVVISSNQIKIQYLSIFVLILFFCMRFYLLF